MMMMLMLMMIKSVTVITIPTNVKNKPDVVNSRDIFLLCNGAELPLRLIWQVDILTLLIIFITFLN